MLWSCFRGCWVSLVAVSRSFLLAAQTIGVGCTRMHPFPFPPSPSFLPFVFAANKQSSSRLKHAQGVKQKLKRAQGVSKRKAQTSSRNSPSSVRAIIARTTPHAINHHQPSHHDDEPVNQSSSHHHYPPHYARRNGPAAAATSTQTTAATTPPARPDDTTFSEDAPLASSTGGNEGARVDGATEG